MPEGRARAPRADSAEETARRLHSAAIHLLRGLRVEDVSSGLTGPRLSALSVLVFGGPMTIGDLAAAEQVRRPTMTRLARALETQGLVRREADPRDGRVVRLHATPKGERLLTEGRERRVRRLAAPLARMTGAERAALARLLELLERVVRDLH